MAELSPNGGRLRIGLDARNLALAQGTGIATYASSLAGEGTELLVDFAPGTPRTGGRPRRYIRAFAGGWRGLATRVEGGVRIADDAFRVAQVHFDIWRRVLVLKGDGLPDLMHWTSPLPLRLAGVPNLYTILDTIPLDHRTSTDPHRFHRILLAIAEVADHVVTLSESARADILRWVPGLAGRISVVPPAVSIAKLPTAVHDAALQDFGLQAGSYYVFAGTIEPRKNVAALGRAFLASASSRCLILAGPLGWNGAGELAPFADAIAAGRIRHVGYVQRDALLALMQGARALLFPSLAEGFGLPVIEAMALGVPVVTSGRGALAEVAGGAALLVDPTDAHALRSAIDVLDIDDTICVRLVAMGIKRAADFTTASQTDRMTALYQEIAGR